ncbi:hypothetical protein MAUB1S_04648 [Mycolicibacterium aubagnense]
MTLPIYFWATVMAFVLNKVWRRYRLSQHGLDPNLIDQVLQASRRRCTTATSSAWAHDRNQQVAGE